MVHEIRVAQDGSGDFVTIQSAIDAVRVHPLEPVTIHVGRGVYQERVVIPDNKPNIRLIGVGAEETIIRYGLGARMLDSEGVELGTFRTSTMTVQADDFVMENIAVANSAGPGGEAGQALALYVSGDRQTYRGVRLLGWQDTFYTARGRQYFYECYIEGDVDFIFGSGTALFDHCEIHSLRKGYITAASTPAAVTYGLVFLDCRLTGTEEAGERSVYLGRPWRPHAHTVYVRTWMDKHIQPEGWDNWRDPSNERTARYGEYDSMGPGGGSSAVRASWSQALTREVVEWLTIEHVLSGADGWNPVANYDEIR
jgi:pectinesterase